MAGINKLPATSRLKNQTLTFDTKFHLDLTKLGRPVCRNRTILSASTKPLFLSSNLAHLFLQKTGKTK